MVPSSLKYRAFLSYSHKDTAATKWLHKRLESYRTAKDLIVDGRWFDVIGLSMTALPDLEVLASAIRKMRSTSLNKNLIVIAGGLAIINHPNFIADVGADAAAIEGQSPVNQITGMIGAGPAL